MATSAVAESAGIHRTHLYRVLGESKSLGKEKLIGLADALGIARNDLLLAAGYESIDPRIDLGSVTPRRLGGTRLGVVTDPRFVDSAIFFWIFSAQPLRGIGIDCELIRTDWERVPEEVSNRKNAIGFFNRRSIPDFGGVRYYMDLCLYKGYALLARRDDVRKKITRIQDAREFLTGLVARKKKEKPTIVCMGADTVWSLRTSLTPELSDQNFVVKPFGNADFALEKFAAGLGDLYVGGLPQRLRACKEYNCIEILNSEINPLLFSMNSLIYSEQFAGGDDAAQPLLSTISALWFRNISALKRDEDMRSQMFSEVQRFSTADRETARSSLTHEAFEAVLRNGAYEDFPDTPTGLVDSIFHITDKLLIMYEKGIIEKATSPGVRADLSEPFKTSFLTGNQFPRKS
jgi:hypothetical protein